MANTNTSPQSPNSGSGSESDMRKEADAARQAAQSDLADLKSKAEDDLHGITETARRDFEEARDAASRYAENRKNDAADQMEGVASAVRRVADELEDETSPMIGRYARELGDGLARFSETARNRSLSDMLGDVQRFGRDHPTAFIAGAAFLGFAASRFLAASSNQGQSMRESADHGRPGSTGSDNSGRVASPAAFHAGQEDF